MAESFNFLTIKDASTYFDVSRSKITYLLDYHDEINRYDSNGNIIQKSTNGNLRVSLKELKHYFEQQKIEYNEQLNLLGVTNLELDFSNLSDQQRTKHVHGLHPYMGKFIPQLVEYYLVKYFNKDNLILDPFAGSGTTLIEANIKGMNSFGVDIAEFNTILMKAKTDYYNLELMEFEVLHILHKVSQFSYNNFNDKSTKTGFLSQSNFSKRYDKLLGRTLNLDNFFIGDDKNSDLDNSLKKDNISIKEHLKSLKVLYESDPPEIEIQNNLDYDFDEDENIYNINRIEESKTEYLSNWLAPRTNYELNYYTSLIPNYNYQNLLKVIVSYAARSSRLVAHYDLTRPKYPLDVNEEYTCRKHKNRRCRPIDNAIKWIRNHSISKKGAISRIRDFSELRTNNTINIQNNDSTKIDYAKHIELDYNKGGSDFDGIITSPPYLGIIDYHLQHNYAYDLFNLPNRHSEEIGSESNGKSQNSKNDYIRLIAEVFSNVKPFLKENADVFIVANDRDNLYHTIFEIAGYELVKEDIRGVYKRASHGGATSSYAENIFHVKPIE
ncbi:MAG: site-specific DNA-methyltransferase [Candidatus Heimdallarchaeota archaeon]|nr:site-specific DNA-methyltransferase [Candidatus Heimdallarchaeota archaeon]